MLSSGWDSWREGIFYKAWITLKVWSHSVLLSTEQVYSGVHDRRSSGLAPLCTVLNGNKWNQCSNKWFRRTKAEESVIHARNPNCNRMGFVWTQNEVWNSGWLRHTTSKSMEATELVRSAVKTVWRKAKTEKYGEVTGQLTSVIATMLTSACAYILSCEGPVDAYRTAQRSYAFSNSMLRARFWK